MPTQTANLIDLGVKGYKDTLTLQMDLVAKRIEGVIGDTLLFVEHPPVITLGRGGDPKNLLLSPEVLQEKGIEFMETNRGGDITYHGIGQLVGYPILNLTSYGSDLHQTMRNYEEVLIQALASYHIEAARVAGLTGVWTGNKKIAAIGVGVKNWVSYHGFALNVNNDLQPFSHIIPCGISDKGVTSMKALLHKELDLQKVKSSIAASFAAVMDIRFKKPAE
jgi:lipoyl(octanoyl) transferase